MTLEICTFTISKIFKLYKNKEQATKARWCILKSFLTREKGIHNHLFSLVYICEDWTYLRVSFCPSKNFLFPEKTVLQAQLVLPAWLNKIYFHLMVVDMVLHVTFTYMYIVHLPCPHIAIHHGYRWSYSKLKFDQLYCINE